MSRLSGGRMARQFLSWCATELKVVVVVVPEKGRQWYTACWSVNVAGRKMLAGQSGREPLG